jgi:uncharacterized protein (TIGR02145 family)
MGKELSPEQWTKVEDGFEQALSFEPNQRQAFLAQFCAGDDELRHEVESLLRADEVVADDFLQSSPFPLGLNLLADEETRRDEMISEPTLVFALPVGAIVDDRYRILEKLAAGGMGEVYKAHDLKLNNRLVVVKVLKRDLLSNSWMVKKFEEEIEALCRIRHSNVAKVYDKGKLPSGEPYLVMEFVEGVTLWQALKKRKERDELLAFSEVAKIMQQIGWGVEAIHQARLIHRDLKPKNIMVCEPPNSREYEVKVIDLGIVRNLGKSTVLGHSPGTVGYMSPEQLAGEEAKYESDIFALGLIAYEMLTGYRPFDSNNPVQLLKLQKKGVKDKPSALRPDLPKAAEQVILKALSFQADKRYQSARTFGDDLASALIVIPDPRLRIPKWLLVGAAVVLIALIIVSIPWQRFSLESINVPDAFVDARDNRQYKIVKIGDQVWMTENLSYNPTEGSVCYDNISNNCDKFGRLYNWVAAKKVCPEGWHLPSNEEWDELIQYLGGDSITGKRLTLEGDSRFAAIMSGYRHPDGRFRGLGAGAYFWAATESNNVYAWYYQVNTERSRVSQSIHSQKAYLAARCVKD